MKKIIFFLFIATAAFTSCKKDTDDRDAFVGTYTETLNGSITFTINGTNYTEAVNDDGTFTIEKISTTNKVARIDGGGSYEATVSGNSIVFDTMYENETTDDGIDLQMTLNVEGVLSGITLNYTMLVTGTGYYNGYAFPISGTITSVATKQ